MNWLVAWSIRTMFPAHAGLPGARDVDVDGFVAKLRAESAPMFWLGVVAGCAVFVLAPVITIGIPLPAFWLPAATLDRYADKVTAHPIYVLRQAIVMVKLVGAMAWAGDARLRQEWGLPAYPADPGTFRESDERMVELPAAAEVLA